MPRDSNLFPLLFVLSGRSAFIIVRLTKDCKVDKKCFQFFSFDLPEAPLEIVVYWVINLAVLTVTLSPSRSFRACLILPIEEGNLYKCVTIKRLL